jgi:hypothetical protein
VQEAISQLGKKAELRRVGVQLTSSSFSLAMGFCLTTPFPTSVSSAPKSAADTFL